MAELEGSGTRCDLLLVESKEDGWSLMDRGRGVVPGGGSWEVGGWKIMW
jgi:hypothetical protein